MPMDDASLAPDSAEIPEDPNMMGDMSNEMPMGDEMPMDNNEMGEDETMEIINQLSPKDKEAVKSYAESLISKDESKITILTVVDPTSIPTCNNLFISYKLYCQLIKTNKSFHLFRLWYISINHI